MANVIYPLMKQRLLEWARNSNGPAGGADLCIIGVKDTYVYSASHETLDDVSGAAIVAPEAVIADDTITLGVVDGDDATLTGMIETEVLDAFIVYYKWPAATLLLCYMDTPTNMTIPQTINSTAGLVEFAAEGIFGI